MAIDSMSDADRGFNKDFKGSSQGSGPLTTDGSGNHGPGGVRLGGSGGTAESCVFGAAHAQRKRDYDESGAHWLFFMKNSVMV